MVKHFEILPGTEIEFFNNVDFCVGTGRMGLALQKEYMEQLKEVQEDIGFKHIRGHGLFSDDMAIYHEYEDENGNIHAEYNFTYLDLVMDSYMSVHIKPFIELGFMPKKMASGEQTVFYWKGNVTPPKSYDMWCDLITATLQHLMDRYGADEVVTWPIEVWNEPNLPGFWKGADMEEYLVLFEKSFNAIKKLDQRFRVGGPAICGVEDKKHMKFFMEFVHNKKLPIDFITRHHYTSELPVDDGHYGYIELRELGESFETLQDSRDIIDSYPEYKGMQMHITEFNTSYIPNAPIHDTNQNAAYVASMLAIFGETSESYSYWTFGDIFEERGVPFTPFHGGFGMMANGCIKKPTYYAFKFFKELTGKCIMKNEHGVICEEAGNYKGVLFNSNVHRTGESVELEIEIPIENSSQTEKQQYTMVVKTVDEDTCNPLKVWHDLGEPSSLSAKQLALLKESDKPKVETSVVTVEKDRLTIELEIKEFGLVFVELIPHKLTSDRGYDYNRVIE